MQHKVFVFLLSLVPVLLALLFSFPRQADEDDEKMLHKYRMMQDGLLSVMTFNIRVDIVERDRNNHFSQRIHRLTETIEKWRPVLLGVQEPLTSQLQDWQSHLPRYYRSIGAQPRTSEWDFQVAILYDSRQLKLLEHDYLWLSKTPRVVNSKDWNSHAIRTLNIARFECNSSTLLVFNTHLDSKSEQARQEQAKIVRSTIAHWQRKHPRDVLLLLGDFNSIPNQTTHHLLTSGGFLSDTWTVCKAHPSTCVSNSFSSTFHAWLGSIINTYGMQLLQTIAFTFHGLGVILPHGMPRNYSSYADVGRKFVGSCSSIDLSKMIALWSSHRFHVDWILYQNSLDGNEHVQPRFISVVDIRSRNYSSDHFPLVALLQWKRQ